jgi:hypothetical protein
MQCQWPGYQPWSRQIPTRDFRNPPGPITRAKLAKNVAKSVARFIAVSIISSHDREIGFSRVPSGTQRPPNGRGW